MKIGTVLAALTRGGGMKIGTALATLTRGGGMKIGTALATLTRGGGMKIGTALVTLTRGGGMKIGTVLATLTRGGGMKIGTALAVQVQADTRSNAMNATLKISNVLERMGTLSMQRKTRHKTCAKLDYPKMCRPSTTKVLFSLFFSNSNDFWIH